LDLKLQITVDGRAYVVDVELLQEEETSQETREPLSQPPPPPPPVAFTQSYPVPVSSDPKVCRSPVMGLAIKVNVESGQTVEAGDLMLVLEAMKMETNMTAPAAGTVKAVHVRQGDSVKLNQPLVEFE
jgi:methylmalonyl-CoA carboxyltransferase 1.3S subunit